MIHIIGVGEVEQHRTHPVLCLVFRRSAQFRLMAVLRQLLRCSVPFHHLLIHMNAPAVILRLDKGGADRLERLCWVHLKVRDKVKVVGLDQGQEGVQQPGVQPQILCQHPKERTACCRFYFERVETIISLLYDTGEAHLNISMADFVVYVVVAPPIKPDQVGQAVFCSLFEVALFQPLPAFFLQAQAVP